MARHRPALSPVQRKLSHGPAIMLIGVMSMFESTEPGDFSDSVGMILLFAGLHIYNVHRRMPEFARNGGRYGPRGPYEKDRTQEFVDGILNTTFDREFRSWFRMSRDSFYHLLSVIQDDPIFISQGRKPQLPVKYQLAAFLTRFGQATATRTASVVQIAEGSVYNHSKRVIHALRQVRPLYVAWPTKEERRKIKQKSRGWGFPGAIGVIDGSYLILGKKPRKDPLSYRTRKKTWGFNMQAVVDFSGRFISYDLGWPGSTPDATVWKSSFLWLRRHRYFEKGEWIMADKGYPISRHLITLYKEDTYDTVDIHERATIHRWNVAFSSKRMTVEHAFGRLKGRFPVLNSIPCYKLEEVLHLAEALLVIHNIMITIGDRADDVIESDGRTLREIIRHERAQAPLEHSFEPTIERLSSADSTRRIGTERRRQLVKYWAEHRVLGI